uniref:BTB domain-containing protein n=1 Tax=Panagrolaimus sp. ES5 TaxID=591445 RepID=A0AC34G2T3_9BILA
MAVTNKDFGTLIEANENLFDTKEFTDMVFVIHGKELPAHKIIVGSRSSVLKTWTHGPMAPKNGKYLVNDPRIDFYDFENFIRYLYTDNCVINETNVKRMMHLGDMYLKSLLEKCISKIVTWFHADNILRYAELGLLYIHSCTLLNKCFEAFPTFVTPFPFSYFSDDGVSHLITPKLALKIVEICPRSKILTEDLLFKKVSEWAELKAAEQRNLGNPSTDYITIMAPIIPHFMFERMTPITLTKYVYP